MPKPILLYVSSSPELQAEREVVGQVVATLPVTIGWRIGHTPRPGDSSPVGGAPLGVRPGYALGEAFAQVADCDLYAVLLGRDFAAPMGHELRQVLARGKRPFAGYRVEGTFSPSAQDAIRTLDIAWQRISTAEVLRSRFRHDLLQAVLSRATVLRLELDEVERLLAQSREGGTKEAERSLRQRQVRQSGDARPRGEAGQSGRILGREVWEAEV